MAGWARLKNPSANAEMRQAMPDCSTNPPTHKRLRGWDTNLPGGQHGSLAGPLLSLASLITGTRMGRAATPVGLHVN